MDSLSLNLISFQEKFGPEHAFNICRKRLWLFAFADVLGASYFVDFAPVMSWIVWGSELLNFDHLGKHDVEACHSLA